MTVTDETEAKVREDRRAAEEYAARVNNGEEPWNDGVEPDPGFSEPKKAGAPKPQPMPMEEATPAKPE